MKRRIVIGLALSVAAVTTGCDDTQGSRGQDAPSPSGGSEVTPAPGTAPKEGTVLKIEPNVVEPNLRVKVTFDPPAEHIWGADAELLKIEDGKARRIAYLSTWFGKKRIRTVWPQPNLGFPDIGFYGKETWEWRVPSRLEPGTYAIQKDAIEDSYEPIEDRIAEWHVRFKVR